MNPRLAEVKSTKDYDLFKRINYNRSIMEPRIDRLVESINKYGFILPILVNKDFMVVDGQHRLEAARKANSHVLYIQFAFTDEMLPILISTVNTTSTNWNNDDYLNMWVAIGKEEYIYMSKIIDKENIGVTIFLRLAGINNNKDSKFKTGELTFTKSQKERIETRLKQLNEIRDLSVSYESFRNTSTFANAIITVISNSQYKHDRMIQALTNSPGSIAKSTSSIDYIEVMTHLYNKGSKNKVRFIR